MAGLGGGRGGGGWKEEDRLTEVAWLGWWAAWLNEGTGRRRAKDSNGSG